MFKLLIVLYYIGGMNNKLIVLRKHLKLTYVKRYCRIILINRVKSVLRASYGKRTIIGL